jgi:hypothetical protein
MSYSFQIRAATKAEAKAKVAAELDKVAAAQVCHERDKAQATFRAFIDLVADDDSQDLAVTCSGSLSGTWQGSDVVRISGANIMTSAGLVPRLAQAAD